MPDASVAADAAGSPFVLPKRADDAWPRHKAILTECCAASEVVDVACGIHGLWETDVAIFMAGMAVQFATPEDFASGRLYAKVMSRLSTVATPGRHDELMALARGVLDKLEAAKVRAE